MIEDKAHPVADDVVTYHALRNGKLTYQRCRRCSWTWLPERTECPHCLQNDFDLLEASGGARLISWVTYHRTVLPAFGDAVPYTVAIVQLREGPRLISNIVDVDEPEALEIDQELRLKVVQRHSTLVPLFVPNAPLFNPGGVDD